MGRAPALRVALLLWIVTFGALAAHGETLALHLNFETQQQSIWGPGTASPSTTTYTIVDPERARWNAQSSGYPSFSGPIETFDTYLFGEVELGVGYKGRIGGAAGLWSTIDITDPGSFHVKYPVEVVLDFPDANSFRAGDTVQIASSYAVQPGWKFDTTSPKFTLSADAEFQVDLDFQAKVALPGATYGTNDIPGYRDLGLPWSYGPGRFNIFTVDENSSLKTPPALSLLIPLSANIHAPNVQTTASLLSDKSMVASGSDEFAKLSLDIDKLFTLLIKKPPLGVTASIAGVSIDTHLFSLKSITTLTADQDLRFDPDLKVSFQFAEPLEHWTTGPAGDTPRTTAASVEMRVGDTLHVTYPDDKKQPTAIDPSFRLDNELSSKAVISAGEDLPALALKLGIKVPEFEIVPELCTPGGCVDLGFEEVCVPRVCTPSVDFPGIDETHGPVWSASLYTDSWAFPSLVDDSWSVDFAQQSGTEFALDPENPIVAVDKVVAATRNLGGGHRTVAWMLTLTNPGDVLLSDVHLADDLAAAFPGARAVRVDRVIGCNGVTLNGAFGPGDDALLGPGNTLPPDATKRVALIASIHPQANPPEFVNVAAVDGTSPLGTFVSDSGSAAVRLGPAPVSTIDDYVVFGDHFVKIEGLADSTGTIGSNDFVEVKNGLSGTLAGDLRAGRFLKVQGTMAADYAFSGGVVDVVGNGRLTLSGDAKPFAQLSQFTIPPVAFVPSTAFAGDVFVAASSSATLAPGSYGRVTVNRNAALRLSGGAYYFDDLVVAPNAGVVMSGEGTVDVRKRLDLGAGARFQGFSTHTALSVAQPGEVSIGQGARVRGVLSAPQANILFDESSSLEGAVYGKSVTLRRGTAVSHHVTCNPAVDPDCDGIPNCL
jgi:hypothetical protein